MSLLAVVSILRPTPTRVLALVTSVSVSLAVVRAFPYQRSTPIGGEPAAIESPVQGQLEACIVEAELPYEVVSGRFDMAARGYSIEVPAGHVGVRCASPTSDSGFRVDLRQGITAGDAWSATKDLPQLGIAALPNAGFAQNLEECVEEAVRLARAREPGAKVVALEDTRLGSLPARRVVLRRECDGPGDFFIEVHVLAWRRDVSFGPVRTKDDWLLAHMIYHAYLSTPEARYEQDAVVFDRMVASWRPTRFE